MCRRDIKDHTHAVDMIISGWIYGEEHFDVIQDPRCASEAIRQLLFLKGYFIHANITNSISTG